MCLKMLGEIPKKIGLRKGNSLQVLLNGISFLNEHTGFESVMSFNPCIIVSGVISFSFVMSRSCSFLLLLFISHSVGLSAPHATNNLHIIPFNKGRDVKLRKLTACLLTNVSSAPWAKRERQWCIITTHVIGINFNTMWM